MKLTKSLPLSVFAAALVLGGLPDTARAHDHYHAHAAQPQAHIITVSCYRGPWEDVIWDRPNPEFTDSLVAFGYTFPEAHAIAERVCRDPNTVGDSDGLRAVMIGILQATPPSR